MSGCVSSYTVVRHAKDENSCSQDFVVYTDSESDKENLMKEAKDERKRVAERKIQSAIGFRQVIDLLSSEKRLEFMQWL
ncbi:hypothetical protein Bca4012_062903 [Brassica carinata]